VRVLLAGGAGFVGSHVADALLARGDEVVAIDNLSTGRRSNLVHLYNNDMFALVEHDVCYPFPDHIALAEPFDAVMDLASPASPSDFARIPLEILSVGSVGTRNLLDRALADGAVFFLASTSEVYGDPLVHPQPETYWGNVMAYQRVHGLDIRIARIFNTYGERMRPQDGRVVGTFIEQALRGEPLTLHGEGNQSRSFCHVSDEVLGLVALLDSTVTEPVNVGNPAEFTMRQLAELVVALCKSSSAVISVPTPPEREGDPMQRCPDITKARDLLDWEPTVSLSDGLSRMIEYFRNYEGF